VTFSPCFSIIRWRIFLRFSANPAIFLAYPWSQKIANVKNCEFVVDKSVKNYDYKLMKTETLEKRIEKIHRRVAKIPRGCRAVLARRAGLSEGSLRNLVQRKFQTKTTSNLIALERALDEQEAELANQPSGEAAQ
jgi:hypothetical protein